MRRPNLPESTECKSTKVLNSERCHAEVARSGIPSLSPRRSTGMQVPSSGRREGILLSVLFALLFPYPLAIAVSSSDKLLLLADHVFSLERLSSTDLENRQSLERNIQLAAFQQFDHAKTGRLYNISVISAPSGSVCQAMRLRSGSFRRYGVDINEFSIPPGCKVTPTPERILLTYARLSGSTLFQNLPEGLVLASPVVNLFVYDASNLNSTQPLDKLTVAATGSPISIRLQPLSSGSSNLTCAFFEDNSTAVNYSASLQNVCTASHLGTFALVGNASSIAPVPSPAPSPPPSPPSGRSNTWKIVVGSVIGGLLLLGFMSLLALGVGKHRRKERFAKMQSQTDQGVALETTIIGNSRAPAAGSTRTQARLEKDDDDV